MLNSVCICFCFCLNFLMRISCYFYLLLYLYLFCFCFSASLCLFFINIVYSVFFCFIFLFVLFCFLSLCSLRKLPFKECFFVKDNNPCNNIFQCFSTSLFCHKQNQYLIKQTLHTIRVALEADELLKTDGFWKSGNFKKISKFAGDIG